MPRSRTVKSLTALVMAMTSGTFVLMLLECKADPLRPPTDRLAATASGGLNFEQVVWQTRVPVQPMKWRYVVVHSAPSAAGELAQGCHFLVWQSPDGRGYRVTPTQRWDSQVDGRHVFVGGHDYNSISIGICLIGEFSAQPPTQEQFNALIALVRQLRQDCGIPADRIYLARQLPTTTRSPGQAFPADLFDRLIRAPLR